MVMFGVPASIQAIQTSAGTTTVPSPNSSNPTPPASTPPATSPATTPASPSNSSGLVLPTNLTNLPTLFKGNLGQTIVRLWDITVAAAAVIFIVLFLIGGLMYLGASGNDEQTKKARQLLLDAVIGIVLVLAAWPVGTFVLNKIGADKNGTVEFTMSNTSTPTTINSSTSDPLRTVASTVTLTVRVKGGKVGDVIAIQSTSSSTGASLPNGIKIASATNDILRVALGAQFNRRVSLGNQGTATVPGVPTDVPIIITLDHGSSTDQIFSGQVYPTDSNGTTATLTLDAALSVSAQVKIRIAVLHQTTTKPIEGFMVLASPVGFNNDDVIVNTDADGHADVFLVGGITYQLTGYRLEEEITPGTECSVPTGPTGTDNPTKVCTVFARNGAASSTPPQDDNAAHTTPRTISPAP